MNYTHDTVVVPDFQTECSQPSEYEVVSNSLSMSFIAIITFTLHRLMSSIYTQQSMHVWIRLCLG